MHPKAFSLVSFAGASDSVRDFLFAWIPFARRPPKTEASDYRPWLE